VEQSVPGRMTRIFPFQYILEKTGGKLGGPGGAEEIVHMKSSTFYNCMKRLGLR